MIHTPPSTVAVDTAHWSRRLADLAGRRGVPGAQLGVLQLDEDGAERIDVLAHGVLHAATGREVRTGSVFQIGSITKVWTATVAMMLVDDGTLSLDSRVGDLLPGFRVADEEAGRAMTVRDLLTHTNGLDGDVFTDTGRGDDALERYVEELRTAGQNHPVGATWSYSNSGYVLLGRIIEVLTGTTWDEAMAQRLFAPLGLGTASTLPEQTILHDAAVGHLTGLPDPTPAPVWSLPRSMGPAGLVVASAADVLRFAALHLRGGLAVDGTRLLEPASVEAMAAFQVELPERHSLGDSWGLGWIRYGWGARRVLGHDGSTIGQEAFLRLLPDRRSAVVLLTNGGQARDLFTELFTELFDTVFEVTVPAPFGPPAEPVPYDGLGDWAGTYQSTALRLEFVEGTDGGPAMTLSLLGPLAELDPHPVQHYRLQPAGERLFSLHFQGAEHPTPLMFFTLDDGARYVHFGGRAAPRVG